MPRRSPSPPHRDDLAEALPHFNGEFRHRYRLPALTEPWLRLERPDIDERLTESKDVRLDGVLDASCSILARIALDLSPRYAIGYVDGAGHVHVQAPDEGDPESYRSGHVVLVNPLGGIDNWANVSGWVRRIGSDRARRSQLAGLASEDRPDEAANQALLWQAVADGRGAIVLPPDEGFSSARAPEVAFIYDVTPDTLKRWKRELRSELGTKTRGAPKRSRST